MKNIFKKNQMIITALAIMIAVAGYLNYSGSRLDSAKVTTDADASAKRTRKRRLISRRKTFMRRRGWRSFSSRTATS